MAESKFVSEKHWQNAWWNAPPEQTEAFGVGVASVINHVKFFGIFKKF